jgi:hypothetical protein
MNKPKTADYLEASAGLVRADRREEWRKHVVMNTHDHYSAAMLEGLLGIMSALTEGQTCLQAGRKIAAMDTSELIKDSLANAVSHFHATRGDEFRQYYFGIFLPEKKVSIAQGAANPVLYQ